MKTKLSYLGMVLAAAFTLSACDYSNDFTGTYNGAPATMSARSKNVKKYCIALNLNSNGTELQSHISAQAVYNENDMFGAKSFNTKGAECSANLTHYLVGTRTTQVMNTYEASRTEQINQTFCQVVYYKAYQYQDSIHFDVKNGADDALIGTFDGKGLVADYVDDARPTRYGQVYQCGPSYPYPGYPGPGGYPYPGPGGYPYPGPGGYPYPGPGGYPYPGNYPPYPYPHPAQ